MDNEETKTEETPEEPTETSSDESTEQSPFKYKTQLIPKDISSQVFLVV